MWGGTEREREQLILQWNSETLQLRDWSELRGQCGQSRSPPGLCRGRRPASTRKTYPGEHPAIPDNPVFGAHPGWSCLGDPERSASRKRIRKLSWGISGIIRQPATWLFTPKL